MATIKDVAETAQVSITTVSHVINSTRFVSPEVRKRVEEAMTQLGYQPNGLARSLRMGKTKTIGLIVPDASNLYFAEYARCIEDLGFQHGYSVILCNTDDNLEKEASYIDLLVNKQVDGVIFISAGGEGEALKKLKSQHIPIVIADREAAHINADLVLLDNLLGGYLATRHMIGLGHRRIACISGPSQLNPSAQRVNGYLQAMREAGLTTPENYILLGDFHFQSGERCMDTLIALGKERPSAVFACNDLMAMGAIRSARRQGLHLPEELSIVGFDNILLSQAFFPALTTIDQPIQEMAEAIIRVLLERMHNKDITDSTINYQRILLKPVLVERDSCSLYGDRNK